MLWIMLFIVPVLWFIFNKFREYGGPVIDFIVFIASIFSTAFLIFLTIASIAVGVDNFENRYREIKNAEVAYTASFKVSNMPEKDLFELRYRTKKELDSKISAYKGGIDIYNFVFVLPWSW